MKPRHIIIGAGISGLALGWFLKKRFKDNHILTILEASERPGGWIQTHHDQDFLFEAGPRSCRAKGPGLDTLQLIEELGLCEEVIGASSQAKNRFLYQNGKLQAIPSNFFSFLLSPLMRGVLPALWKEWQTPPSNLEDESIAQFISRRLSPEIAEKLMDPLVSGIYAGDIHQLSMHACFPELHRMELEHGSLVKGMLRKKKEEDTKFSEFIKKQRQTPIFSFKRGMETLVTALYHQLKDCIKLSCSAKRIYGEKDALRVELFDNTMLKADKVFLAIPAHAAAEILKTIDADAAHQMSKEPYATVATVNLGWNRKILKQEGFGYLVPKCEKQNILGTVFDSSAFPQQNCHVNQTRLTVMIGGTHHPEVENFSHAEINQIALEAIFRHLGVVEKPDVCRTSVARQAIPQYTIGHQDRLNACEQTLKHITVFRLHLLGSAWRGVAVNDCIAEAKKLALSKIF